MRQPDPNFIFRRGETWRFADGRVGTVASANTIGATIYVGPQAFSVPAGDWPAALRGARLVPDQVACEPVEPQDLPAPDVASPVSEPTVEQPPETVPPTAVLDVAVPPAPAPVPVPAAIEPAPEANEVELVEPATETRRSRRGRKRDA